MNFSSLILTLCFVSSLTSSGDFVAIVEFVVPLIVDGFVVVVVVVVVALS